MSVYALRDPRTGACRYVGHSHNPLRRLKGHLASPHSAKLQAWYSELEALGMAPTLEILPGGTEAEWMERLGPDLNILPGSDSPRQDRQPDVGVTIRFPGRVFRAAAALAREDQRSFNSWVVRAVSATAGVNPSQDAESKKARG